MFFKKSTIVGGSAVALAIAGTGVAAAEQDNAGDLPTNGNGSSTSSLGGANLSEQLSAAFGSSDADGNFNLNQAVSALIGLAAAGTAVAGSISIAPNIYNATKDIQQFVDDFTEDSRNFINSITP